MEHLFENWRNYLTEEQVLTEEQITQYIVESNIEHLWENNNFDNLNEQTKDWLRTAGHIVLGVLGIAGDVAAPGVGAIFDAINMIWYLKRGCWLYAGFSALSLIPYLGDLLGKGGKLLTYLNKGIKYIKTLKKQITKHESKIEKLFNKLEGDKKSPEIVKENSNKMMNALRIFAKDNVYERPDC